MSMVASNSIAVAVQVKTSSQWHMMDEEHISFVIKVAGQWHAPGLHLPPDLAKS